MEPSSLAKESPKNHLSSLTADIELQNLKLILLGFSLALVFPCHAPFTPLWNGNVYSVSSDVGVCNLLLILQKFTVKRLPRGSGETLDF